jgi:hypothetical protein
VFCPCISVEQGVVLCRVDPSVHWHNEICVVSRHAIVMKLSIAEGVAVDVDGVPVRCHMVARELVSLGI